MKKLLLIMAIVLCPSLGAVGMATWPESHLTLSTTIGGETHTFSFDTGGGAEKSYTITSDGPIQVTVSRANGEPIFNQNELGQVYASTELTGPPPDPERSIWGTQLGTPLEQTPFDYTGPATGQVGDVLYVGQESAVRQSLLAATSSNQNLLIVGGIVAVSSGIVYALTRTVDRGTHVTHM